MSSAYFDIFYLLIFDYVIGHFGFIVTCVWAGWPRVPVGGNPVNRVTLIVLFYAGLFLFHLCACEMNE